MERLPVWDKVRPYADVKVGERVYTIGSPEGLELSLAEGIVSPKRIFRGGRYVANERAELLWDVAGLTGATVSPTAWLGLD
jgi:hypothetical protein